MGGGEDDGPGDTEDFLCLEDRLEPRDGVRYGVSVGVGRDDTAATHSSSVSHGFILAVSGITQASTGLGSSRTSFSDVRHQD